MSHATERIESFGEVKLTREEQKVLIKLLKHPKIREMANEIKEDDKSETK